MKGEGGEGVAYLFSLKDNGDNFITQIVTSFYNFFGGKTCIGLALLV